MTIKTMRRTSSEVALASIRDAAMKNESQEAPAEVIKLWSTLPQSVRSMLVSQEFSNTESQPLASSTSSPSLMSSASSSALLSSDDGETKSSTEEILEECPETGSTIVLSPLERAPKNVFAFKKKNVTKSETVTKSHHSEISTTTKVVTSGRGWRNIFSVPISYDVNMVKHGTLLDPLNPELLLATGTHPEGYNRRFAVIDAEVEKIYGDKIRNYFVAKGIELTTCTLNGGEADKRSEAVDKLLDELCAYKCRRREPFLAIGGGCLLDMAGLGACLYRRGVPFVRVPTTLLAIVDASVGVKNGVDHCCGITDETYKNRVGSFYAPSSCLLDNSFMASQNKRNISNGFGEIVKLALVRSCDLFELLESHGAALVESRFAAAEGVPDGVSDRIIDLSIQIMLEELGPNLWEKKLDRCVDYGHTFSKLLEMVPGADIMHGEAVNIDGFFCVVLSFLRGYIEMETVKRVLHCMQSLSLPTNSKFLVQELAWQSCKDAIEHRHGEMRIPLITDIGESICVNDITEDELSRALDMMKELTHKHHEFVF